MKKFALTFLDKKHKIIEADRLEELLGVFDNMDEVYRYMIDSNVGEGRFRIKIIDKKGNKLLRSISSPIKK